MSRSNVFVIHSWEEADAYARMKELLAARESGLADFSVPPWKALPGPDDEIAASIDNRIQRASAVVVLNTPQLHHREWSSYEMTRAVEMNKRIVVLQPHGEFEQSIPQVLDGNVYRVAPWRSDVLGRAIRGEYPQDGRVFDISEVLERRELVKLAAGTVGFVSLLVAVKTAAEMKRLTEELAKNGMQLAWTNAEIAQVAIPALAVGFATMTLTALFTRDAKSALMAGVAGATAGATYGLLNVHRARVLGTKQLRVLTVERIN